MDTDTDQLAAPKRRRWFQFSLRTLLIGVAAFSVVMAFFKWQYSASRQLPGLIQELDDRPGGFIDLGWHGRQTTEIQADIRRYGTEATPYLLEALDHRLLHHPELIIDELGAAKDPRAVQPLIAQLASSDDWRARASAAHGLGELGDHRAVQPLLDYVRDDTRDNHWTAISALGKIGDTVAAPQLILVLDDKETARRAYAAEALGRLADPRAVGPLLDLLDREQDSWVRKLAAIALGSLGDRRALPILTKASHDDAPDVRAAAIHAIVRITDAGQKRDQPNERDG